MYIDFSFISPSEINYIKVGGRINNHYYKNVRIYNYEEKENLTDTEDKSSYYIKIKETLITYQDKV